MHRTISGTRVHVATLEEGQELIGVSDVYTSNLSDYERAAKVQRFGVVTEQDYLECAASHVRAWTNDEVYYLSKLLDMTDQRLNDLGIKLPLPDDIWLVKTTGGEEGGANGYTRSANIFFNQDSSSLRLLQHELFHVASRFDLSLRDACYATIGFHPISPITYDHLRRISNPDAPSLQHVVEVTNAGRTVKAAIVLSGIREYDGGSFFGYVEKRLLVMSKDGRQEGQLLGFGQVAGLYEHIGRNTAYNIHQEEVCASHFELLLAGRKNLPNPELIEALHTALAKRNEEHAA